MSNTQKAATPQTEPPDFIKLLAHELRWKLLQVLVMGDHRVQELVGFVGQPLNLVSYHLKHLRDQQVVTVRRSDADGRDMYYSLDVDRLQSLYRAAGAALHPTLASEPIRHTAPLPAQVRVLFLCTQNSARSQMAEGLLRHLGGGQIEVASAGSQPSAVHPLAVQMMKQAGIDISSQKSRHVDEFVSQSFDYVITVCDKMREVCPTFPAHSTTIHWSLPDPAVIEDEAARLVAFAQTAAALHKRITLFLTMIVQKDAA